MRGCRRNRTLIRRYLMELPLTQEESHQMQTHLAICPQKIYEQHQKVDVVLHTIFEPYRNRQDEVVTRLTQRLYATKIEDMVLSIPWWYTYRKVLTPVIISICILLTITLSLWYQSISQRIVIKQTLGSGMVSLSPSSKQWVQVYEGVRLSAGSQLSTNQWSKIELQVGLGTHLWINQSTIILISRNQPLALEIEKGELFISQWRLKSIYQVRTPAGIVTPIGTSYDVRVAENGDTQITVTAGKVRFANMTGAVIIPAGYQSEAGVKQQMLPSKPMRIDTAPITNWVDKFKKVILYSGKTRENLAKEASALGLKYYNERRYYDSLTAYRNVVELVPDRAAGYSGMGIVYANLKQYNNAIIFCQQALTMDSTYKNANARYYLVVSLVTLGRYAEAKPHAEILVKQVPSNHAASIILAEIYRNLGYLDDAERWYRYGLTQSPCGECIEMANKGLKDIAIKRLK
jgi:hypothetical protein